jgi:hypothetical protein
MAEENNEILEFVGFDPEKHESIEDFKKEFSEKFITVEDAVNNEAVKKAITGRYFGSINTSQKRLIKDLGIELEDLEGKKIEDINDAIAEAAKAKLEELKASSNATETEQLTKLQEDLEKAQRVAKEEKIAKESVVMQFEEFKAQTESTSKQAKLSNAYEEARKVVKFKQDLTDVESIGFNHKLKESFVFDFDADGVFTVTDKNGNRIKNENKAGEFLSPSEVMQKLAAETGLNAINPTDTKFKTGGKRKVEEAAKENLKPMPKRGGSLHG